MENFSLEAIKSLILANQLMTIAIISFMITMVLTWAYWEKVGYWIMRVWHGVPVIGTVARMGSKDPIVQADGWTNVETDLCRAYLTEYNKVNKSPAYFKQCQDYLKKVGEAGRKPRPLWVLLLAIVLIIVEAIGFGYVLASWLNLDASASDRRIMAVGVAILLAVASCILAEMAGHVIHHNSLVKKARAWWQGDEPATRTRQLKEISHIHVEDSFTDNDAKDYQQILARISTNAEVMPKHGAIIVCIAFVALMAVGAFVVRSATLNTIESDMINSLRAEASAQQSTESSSPFELPEESQEMNSAADEETIQSKMDAIRQGSLVTYIILSLIYVAIQGITIWLAMVYGFSGVHSRRAWQFTYRFNTAEEMSQWMQAQRIKIAGHADHKLNKLQQKLASKNTTNSRLFENIQGEGVHKRDFLGFIQNQNKRANEHDQEAARSVTTEPAAQPQPPAPPAQSEAPAPAPTPAPAPAAAAAAAAATEIDAAKFHDLTALTDEKLATFAKAMKLNIEQLLEVREQQKVLKEMGLM